MIENMKIGKETILIVDEAQLLNESIFEEIRLLLNFQLNNRFLLTILLLGQPELRYKVKNIEQLDQRIAIKYHLKPFDLEETLEYINFRLQKAGKNENIFSQAAVEKVYEHTKGVPRKINNLCDLALLIGFSSQKRIVDPEIVENIISDGTFL
jgi:type II secretory pathway predicted ATPase ExeA